MTKEPIPLQYMLEGVKAEKLLDSEFLGELEKNFKKFRVINITIFTEEDDPKKRDMISIGYPRPAYENEDKLILDSNFPENLEKVLNIVNKDE